MNRMCAQARSMCPGLLGGYRTVLDAGAQARAVDDRTGSVEMASRARVVCVTAAWRRLGGTLTRAHRHTRGCLYAGLAWA